MQNRIYAELNLRGIDYPKLALRRSRPFGPIMIKAMCDQRHFRWQTGIDKDRKADRELCRIDYAESTTQNRLRRIDYAELTTQNRLRQIDSTQRVSHCKFRHGLDHNRPEGPILPESTLRRINSMQNRLNAESNLCRIESTQNQLPKIGFETK